MVSSVPTLSEIKRMRKRAYQEAKLENKNSEPRVHYYIPSNKRTKTSNTHIFTTEELKELYQKALLRKEVTSFSSS